MFKIGKGTIISQIGKVRFFGSLFLVSLFSCGEFRFEEYPSLTESEDKELLTKFSKQTGYYFSENEFSDFGSLKLNYFVKEKNHSYFLMSRGIGIYNKTIICMGGKMEIIGHDSLFTILFEKKVATIVDRDSVNALFKKMMSAP